MPDISMCLNKSCSVKDNCYRFRSVANEINQSYSDFKEKDKDKCFIPISKNNINNKTSKQ